MVAIDILEVPRSYRNNCYLLVIQDYFTKWADAVPLPSQTAVCITNALVKVLTDYGLPDPCPILSTWTRDAIFKVPSSDKPWKL